MLRSSASAPVQDIKTALKTPTSILLLQQAAVHPLAGTMVRFSFLSVIFQNRQAIRSQLRVSGPVPS
jgi:hypothetical protein